MTWHRERRWAWSCVAALAAIAGCSADPRGGGDQPYGAGSNAGEGGDDGIDEPDAGSPPMSGSGGASGMGSSGGAGGEEPLPACEMIEPGPVGACVVLPDDATNEHLNMTGVVMSIDPVIEPACGERRLGEQVANEGRSAAYELVIAEGESTTRVSVRWPSSPPLVAVGDTVSVEYKAELPPDSVGHGDLTVRDAQGRLVLWVVQAAHGFDSVQLPGLTISDDVASCSLADACGTSTRRAVRAFDGTNEVSIPYGEWALLGQLMIMHGDNTSFTAGPGCRDAADFQRVVIAVRPIGDPSLLL